MRLPGPLKALTMFQPNDGFRFEAGIPLSQRFQGQVSWAFSNKRAPEFEIMAMVMGGGNMMNEEDMSMV